MIKVTPSGGAVVFEVRVVPRASRSQVVGELDGALKVRIAAPPVDGAANAELIKLLSKHLGVSRSDIEIIGGLSSKSKRVRITGIEPSALMAVLQA